MFSPSLEHVVVRQGVVDPPEARAHKVCENDVNGVVAPPYHQEHHPGHGGQEREPVESSEGTG